MRKIIFVYFINYIVTFLIGLFAYWNLFYSRKFIEFVIFCLLIFVISILINCVIQSLLIKTFNQFRRTARYAIYSLLAFVLPAILIGVLLLAELASANSSKNFLDSVSILLVLSFVVFIFFVFFTVYFLYVISSLTMNVIIIRTKRLIRERRELNQV